MWKKKMKTLKFENNMESNYICEKHKKIIEERKPKCKYCELDKLPDTSNRKWKLLSDMSDKETILKIEGKEYPLIWDKERNKGTGAYYCPALELYLERFGNITSPKTPKNDDDDFEPKECYEGYDDD